VSSLIRPWWAETPAREAHIHKTAADRGRAGSRGRLRRPAQQALADLGQATSGRLPGAVAPEAGPDQLTGWG
jgi:hypothetical protein